MRWLRALTDDVDRTLMLLFSGAGGSTFALGLRRLRPYLVIGSASPNRVVSQSPY
jgi:hypothetical protein